MIKAYIDFWKRALTLEDVQHVQIFGGLIWLMSLL